MPPHCMTRRQLLALSGSALTRPALGSEPRNLSFPLANIPGAITPAESFFIRDHFSEPELSLSSWTLTIEGRVAHPLRLTLADILESPTVKLEALLECAGNAPGGAAASNGTWEGVSIAHLLRQVGAAKDAVTVLLEGADSGRLLSSSPDLPYCQIVPAAKCLRSESMVAFKLNDRFLPRANGFPARALFPGWYAMDSVKWLRRIVVLGPHDPPSNFQASGMDKFYNRIVAPSVGEPKTTRLTEILVKSAIAWPTDNMKLPAGRHLVRGFAWAGAGVVRGVQVSADGGRVWAPAKLESTPKPFTWVRWSQSWLAEPGDHVLTSRATDDAGREQPLKRDPARRDGYELNFCAPTPCSVR
jgi:DMSO/TMAO reductase YedYZ molybdopterin-dependent catalytic subunit